ncbi:hypothetical protein GQ44DRAFT_740942 [Phaeosphaeriaceae sp. PMI808]|nr:hypothetical protein GQ44DRAFT_740942 [Phaeosphaeriaceae sp. PMI808]
MARYNQLTRWWSHVTKIINEEISGLAPYAGLILTISLVIYFLVRYYVYETFLLRKIYGKIFNNLDDIKKRGFINHHIAATAKVIMFFTGAYPLIAVLSGAATVHTPLVGSKRVTMGDMLLVLNQVFVGMYIFELIFRAKLSPVAVLHHVGSVLIAAAAVAISLNWENMEDATIEFLLCMIWGLFDVICEFWPHLAIILYGCIHGPHFPIQGFPLRWHNDLRRQRCRNHCCFLALGLPMGALDTAFKIVTPILHVIFMSAQLWGAYNFYKMWRRQMGFIEKRAFDEEHGVGEEQAPIEEQRTNAVNTPSEEQKSQAHEVTAAPNKTA